jgi:hypothetical protein
MPQVILQVQLDIALQLHNQQPRTNASTAIETQIKEFNVSLEPLHPGSTDPQFISYFVVQTADTQTANQLMAALRRCPGVEAAYLKPLDELP